MTPDSKTRSIPELLVGPQPLRSEVGRKLDDTIIRMLRVIDRYAEDSRGPNAGWTRQLAETVEVLMRCRRLA